MATETHASPRRILGDHLLVLAKTVRNGRYHARRGAVNWAAFDFDAHPHAIAVVFDEVSLFPDARAMFRIDATLEIFTRFGGEDAPPSIDDAAMDELHEDARWILEQLFTRPAQDGDRAALGMSTINVKAVETHDADLRVQGLIVPFLVSV